MNDRFKFRVWDKNHNAYISSQMIGTLLYFGYRDEFHIEFKCFSTFADSLIIEQCTGLKDKNGNLIYEGDIVEITIFGLDEIFKGTVVWDTDCFLVKTDTADMILFPHSEDCIKIIGNIHEQAEQKD